MNALYNLAVIYSVIDKMTGPAKKIFGAIKNYDKMIEKGQGWVEYGNKANVAGALTQGAADRMMNSLRSILGPTTEINDSLANLESVTVSTMGSMEKSMTASRRSAIQWSRIHSDSAAIFLNASTIIAGAGLNDIQAIEGTRVALTVAKATFGEAGESAELLGVLYNNMGDKTRNVRDEMQKLGDVVTVTQQMFQIKNMSQLNEGLKYAIPTAKQYKSSLQEVSTVVGMLNTSGLAGSQAGTAYAATMRQIIKASNSMGFAIGRNADGGISLIKTIENIRAKYGEFGNMSDTTKVKFQEAFGDEGLRTISLLLGKTGDMNKALIAVTNSTGAAAKAQKLIEMKSPSEQYRIMQNNINAVKDTIAVKLFPTINKMIPMVIKLVNTLGSFAEKHPGITKLAIGLFALGAVLLSIVAPIMSVVGGFISMAGYGLQGIGKLTKGFLYLQKLATSGKVISGITALGRASKIGFSICSNAVLGAARAVWAFTAALLANPITWIVIAVVALAVGAYLLIKNWTKVKTFFIGLWTSITGIWNRMPGWSKNLINALLLIFMPIIGIPLLIIRNWGAIKAFFIGLWGGIVNVWNTAFNWVKQNISILLAVFLPFIGIPLLIIQNWNRIGPMFGRIFNWIMNIFNNLTTMAYQWGSNLIGNFIAGIKEKIALLTNGLVQTAQQIKNYLGFHSPAETGPGSTAHKWAPNLMKMYESGIIQNTPKVQRAALTVATGISNALTQSPSLHGRSRNTETNSSGNQSQQLVVNFNGPVTIVANNPEDLWTQLKTLAEEVA